LMMGFYAWQTHSNLHRQNDALLYGVGFNGRIQAWKWENSLGGYYGYLGNGDRPLLFRSQLLHESSSGSIGLLVSTGLQDYPFSSVGIRGQLWLFDRKR
nr:hypothetical protein [Saprospiraceae bacterium]